MAVFDGDRQPGQLVQPGQPGQLVQRAGDALLAIPDRHHRSEPVVNVQAALHRCRGTRQRHRLFEGEVGGEQLFSGRPFPSSALPFSFGTGLLSGVQAGVDERSACLLHQHVE